jgi:hypothetical protein
MDQATARLVCTGPECDRALDPIQNKTGLCRSHYKQRHLGKPLTQLRVATKDLNRPAVCVIDGCDRPHKARGYCKTHNERVVAGQDLDAPIQQRLSPGPCEVESCGRPRFANGLCTRHNANRITRWRFYGLTPERGAEMHEAQGGACAICRAAFRLDDLHVDHDHACCKRGSCGKCVRGLLCPQCNLGIGQLADRVDRLRAAIEYLTR